MRTRVGINGMGRVGRDVLRLARSHYDRAFEVVAVNDTAPIETLGYLLRHDRPSGRPPGRVEVSRSFLAVDGQPVRVLAEPDPATLPWADLGVDIVVEAAEGQRDPGRAAAHLAAGALGVVLTTPGEAADVTLVIGVNDDDYRPTDHRTIAQASAATSCLAPMLAVLHRSFGIRRGLVTTVQGDSVDTPDDHRPDGLGRDLRGTRAAAVSIIPASFDVTRPLEEVLPEVAGRIEGLALRVPMADASITDVTVLLNEVVTRGQVNRAFAEAASGYLKSTLRYSTEPLVSTDIVGESASCVHDAGLTTTSGTVVKVYGWYDGQSSHAHRMVELIDLVARTLPEARS